jgi:hypothetical protein
MQLPGSLGSFEKPWNDRLGLVRRRWVTWAIVAAVLVAAAGLGFLAPRAEARQIFLVAGALLAVAPLVFLALNFITQRREWAPLLILFAALFIPWDIPVRGSSFVASLILTLVLAGLWLLKMLTVERRLSLLPSALNRPVLGFGLVVLISLVWSNIFRDSLVIVWPSFPFVQVTSSLVMIMLPVLSLMVINYFDDLKWLRRLVILMLLAGLLGLVSEFALPVISVQTRGTFTMWVVSLALGLLFWTQRNWWLKLALILIVLGWCYWSFGLRITWLASWLPTLVALLVLFFMRSYKLLLLLVAVALIWGYFNQDYLVSIFASEQEESGLTRLAAWGQNWLITREHLLFGTGPAGYAVYYMTYFPQDAMATHSNYIDIISQLGVFGFGFYLWTLGSAAWFGFRLCRRLKGRRDFTEALANAAFAGVVGCLVINAFGDWVIPFAYTQGVSGYDYAAYNWLFIGALFALDRLTRDGGALSKHRPGAPAA